MKRQRKRSSADLKSYPDDGFSHPGQTGRARKSGTLLRNAVMTTSSEEGILGWKAQSMCRNRPNQIGSADSEAPKDSLSDEADLNVSVIGVEFSADRDRIAGGSPVQTVISGTEADGVHMAHPEVLRIDPFSADEENSDFEAQTIALDEGLKKVYGRRSFEITKHAKIWSRDCGCVY